LWGEVEISGETQMIGNFKYSVDDKGRITIPSKLRNELGDTLYVTKDFDNVLSLRTRSQFDELQNTLLAQSAFSKDVRNLQRTIIGNTFELTPDKQGRILLPKNLMDDSGIKNEVVIVASGNRIEIFSTKA
jgi:MraZ protein